MSFWENHKIKKKVKKEEKRINDIEKKADLLANASDTLVNLHGKSHAAKQKIKAEESFHKHLDKNKLEDEITEAKSRLYVQRKKLLRRFVNFNAEYSYLCGMPDTPMKQQELNRCRTGSKNAAYALAIVEQAIDRLDNLPNEYEWREIMRDLTKGYKLVNSITLGSELLTRLAFLWQKAKYDLKSNLSVRDVEHYYGRSIDKLLEEQQIDKATSEFLVKDEALQMNDESKILEAVRWGTIYTVQPNELANAAAEQSIRAHENHSAAIYDNPEETFEAPMDLDSALDNLPSTM